MRQVLSAIMPDKEEVCETESLQNLAGSNAVFQTTETEAGIVTDFAATGPLPVRFHAFNHSEIPVPVVSEAGSACAILEPSLINRGIGAFIPHKQSLAVSQKTTFPISFTPIFEQTSPNQNAGQVIHQNFERALYGPKCCRRITHALLPATFTQNTAIQAQPELKKAKRKSFKRVNIKPPTGNNRYGRKGTLACAPCRKRNSKCIFSSEWLPCEFCRSHKIKALCIKEQGPKAQTRMAPSRPLPTPTDCIISQEEGLLLAYAYTGSTRWNTLKAFFLTAAAEYSPAISSLALRHSIIASAAHALPPEQFREAKAYHQQLAWKTFSSKIDSCLTLEDSDIFAGAILADMMWDSNPTFPLSLETVQRILGLLQAAQKGELGPRRSNMLLVFGPYFVDGLRFCEMTGLTLTAGPSQWYIRQRSSFRECCRYYREFERIQASVCSGDREGLFDTLHGIVHALICCAYRMAMAELNCDETWITCVSEALPRIRMEFLNPDLQKSISDILSSSFSPRMNGQPDGDANYSFSVSIILECIKIFFSILGRRSIMSSLNEPESTAMALSILSLIFCRDVDTLHLRNVPGMYDGCLLIAGLAVSEATIQDYQTTILEELKNRGKDKAASTLSLFWFMRTSEKLVDLVKELLFIWICH